MASKERKRSDWRNYEGEYTVTLGGGFLRAIVYVQNGYLYIRYGLLGAARGLRLTEFKPGVFLTADCRAVRFHDGRMTFGDVAFTPQSARF
jgi:hypothetical protein